MVETANPPTGPRTRPVALVTGASSGIGYELAKQFAANGYDLVVTAEDDGIVDAAKSVEELGATGYSVQVDLTTYDGVEKLYAAAKATGRPIEAVAINAGVGVSGAFAGADTSLEDHLRLVALNVTSTVHLAKRILDDMVARGSGKVLFTSSVASRMPGPYYATYGASKSFVQSFAEAVRYELKDTGVTVTSLMPGPTDTEFFERAGMQDTRVGQSDKKDDPAEVARDGFEALMAGKDSVVAGSAMNKVQATSGKLMPDPAAAAVHARMTEPGKGT